MRAAVLSGYGQPLRITNLPIPAPGPGEILIKLQASGVCHSDVHVWQGDSVATPPPNPYILGHEGVGVVMALGSGVTDWQVGERAGAAWLHDTCGACEVCLAGQESFCADQRAHGFHVPGTFAEFVVAQAAFAVKLPAGEASDLAPLMCAGLTAYGAVDRAELLHGQTCAIFGCGGLGLYAVQLAVRRGVRVVAVDNDPAKLTVAARMGATTMLQSGPDLAANWPEAERAHATINFAPTTRTWDAMLAATKPLGRIVAAAMVSEPVPLVQEWLTWTGVTIMGTSVGTRAQMRDLMGMQAVTPLIGQIEKIALDDVSSALQALHKGRANGRYCVIY
jgi:alcohol dehydrogenase, propanol-preferring